MCGVTETDCSCTASISSQNSEHCKFEFNHSVPGTGPPSGGWPGLVARPTVKVTKRKIRSDWCHWHTIWQWVESPNFQLKQDRDWPGARRRARRPGLQVY